MTGGGPLANVVAQPFENGRGGRAHLLGHRLHADDLHLDSMKGVDDLAEQRAQGLHLTADRVELAVDSMLVS